MDAADRESLKELLPIALFFFTIVVLPVFAIWLRRRRKKMFKAGFEQLPFPFWLKEDELYYNSSFSPANAKLVEVVGVSEITRNARLVQLEIRFRMDGVLQSKRISGASNFLLGIEDKLGYGG